MLRVKYVTGLLPPTSDRARFENRRQRKRIVLTIDISDNEPPYGGFFLCTRFSYFQRKERDSIACRIVDRPTGLREKIASTDASGPRAAASATAAAAAAVEAVADEDDGN